MQEKQISPFGFGGRELVDKRRLARGQVRHLRGAQIADRSGVKAGHLSGGEPGISSAVIDRSMHEQSRLPCDKQEGGGSL
jgi:hypothetical protein